MYSFPVDKPTHPHSELLKIERLAHLAILAAQWRSGATSPNPSVSAIAWDNNFQLLGLTIHHGSGSLHAEAKLIQELQKLNRMDQVAGIFITLEPCNHHGRTGPCTEAILNSGIKNIFFGSRDRNPSVNGNGAMTLLSRGIKVNTLLTEFTDRLYATYERSIQTDIPWITLKKALRHQAETKPAPTPEMDQPDWTMIPPPGQTTFTQLSSLKISHAYRRRADAIITGSGTVLADSPQFNIRHIPDHSPPRTQKQILAVLDRQERVPKAWILDRKAAGFNVIQWKDSFSTLLENLGNLGCQEALVEAGPTLTGYLEKNEFWDTRLTVFHDREKADLIQYEHRKNACWEWDSEKLLSFLKSLDEKQETEFSLCSRDWFKL